MVDIFGDCRGKRLDNSFVHDPGDEAEGSSSEVLVMAQ